jgi:hypothetical protein
MGSLSMKRDRAGRRLRATAIAAALCWLSGCGSAAPASGAAARSSAAASSKAPDGAAGAPDPAMPQGQFATRRGELTNPDQATMVFLYYDLAGMAAPIDSWVEEDGRVAYVRGPDKAAHRAAVHAELAAGAASVRGVGVLHLSITTSLSDYDPGYGEYTIGALSPSSVLQFEALGQKVQLKFGNALAAQIWSVPRTAAQAIEDRVDRNRLDLDVTLKVRSVQPGPGGGTITADVLDYVLRDAADHGTIAKVTVKP